MPGCMYIFLHSNNIKKNIEKLGKIVAFDLNRVTFGLCQTKKRSLIFINVLFVTRQETMKLYINLSFLWKEICFVKMSKLFLNYHIKVLNDNNHYIIIVN